MSVNALPQAVAAALPAPIDAAALAAPAQAAAQALAAPAQALAGQAVAQAVVALAPVAGSSLNSLANPAQMTPEAALLRLDVIGASFDVTRAELLQEILRMEVQINPSNSEYRSLSEPFARLKHLATIRELNHLPRRSLGNIAIHVLYAIMDVVISRAKATIEFARMVADSCLQFCRSTPAPLNVQAARTRCEQLERSFLESRQRFQAELEAMAASPVASQPHVMNRINRAMWHLAGYRVVIHSLPDPQ